MKRTVCLLVLSFFIAIALTLISIPSHAQVKAYGKNELLRNFEEAGGQVEYLGHSYGLDGWLVINPKGSTQYVYTNKQGATLIGMLFSPDAKMETQRQLKAFVAKSKGSQAAILGAELSNASNAERIYADMELRSNWISIGEKDAPYIYTFINIYCDHCHEFLKELMPYIDEGKISVRLIPYGKQPENNKGAAVLLSVDDPLSHMKDIINGVGKKGEAPLIKNGVEGKLIINNYFAEELVSKMPPFTIYRKVSDSTLNVISGVPKNVMSLMADLIKVEKKIIKVEKDTLKPEEKKIEPKTTKKKSKK